MHGPVPQKGSKKVKTVRVSGYMVDATKVGRSVCRRAGWLADRENCGRSEYLSLCRDADAGSETESEAEADADAEAEAKAATEAMRRGWRKRQVDLLGVRRKQEEGRTTKSKVRREGVVFSVVCVRQLRSHMYGYNGRRVGWILDKRIGMATQLTSWIVISCKVGISHCGWGQVRSYGRKYDLHSLLLLWRNNASGLHSTNETKLSPIYRILEPRKRIPFRIPFN